MFTPRQITPAPPQYKKRMPKRQPKSPRHHAIDTAEHGRQIANAIDAAIDKMKPADADILSVYRERVNVCSQQTNLWMATDLHNSLGEAFDGAGRFWTCGQKLCPYCLQKQSQRNRRVLRRRIGQQGFITTKGKWQDGLKSGEHWKFLTLTMENPGLPLIATRSIINEAWEHFRKRVWFEKTFLGGCKAEEFTLTRRGYHYHLHLLVKCRYIDWDDWRSNWTDCVRNAFAKANQPFDVANKDKLLSCVQVDLQGNTETAVHEVAKYITKSDSWRRLRPDDLLDVLRIERWPRMFEFFGSFRSPRERSEPVAGLGGETLPTNGKQPGKKTILDTTGISDLDTVAGWRKSVHELGLLKYLQKLQKQMESMRTVRMIKLKEKYGAASFSRFSGEPSINIVAVMRRVANLYDDAGLPRPPTIAQPNKKLRDTPLYSPYDFLQARRDQLQQPIW